MLASKITRNLCWKGNFVYEKLRYVFCHSCKHKRDFSLQNELCEEDFNIITQCSFIRIRLYFNSTYQNIHKISNPNLMYVRMNHAWVACRGFPFPPFSRALLVFLKGFLCERRKMYYNSFLLLLFASFSSFALIRKIT